MTRTFLISGAGSGIGRAIAMDLATAGSDVELVLVGRRAEPLEATRGSLPRSQRHTVVEASQTKRSELHAAISRLDLSGRNLVGVIANAGVGGENTYGDGDRWGEIIETNLSGTYYLINECLPALLTATTKPRNIVIVSSILARLGIPGYSAYCASKAGLLGLMRSLAATHARNAVYVNAICPGWVDTEMAREGIQQFASHTGKSYDDALARQLALVPTGKMATPAEIGSLVTYLTMSVQSSFTGQCFDMNNGALMP